MPEKRYDILIVGGGIAGLAIGEIFARSGFKVALTEKNGKLCREASGAHHEWFHFGSLYSIFPNNQFLRTMVGGIDDLLVYYRDFEGMNLRITSEGKLITINKANRWIREDNLEYIVNARNDPDFYIAGYEGIKDLCMRVFFKYAWDKNIKQFISRHNRFYKYDWRRGCASVYIPKAGWLDYSRELIEKFRSDEVNLDPDTHFKIKSYDRPMNAYNIIEDLTKSYVQHGGEIFVEHEFEKYISKKDGVEAIFKNGMVLRAQKLILSAGKNLEMYAKGKLKIKNVVSPLLVAYPSVCSTNLVRLTPFVKKTINHLRHEIDGVKYSLIGGGYFADPLNPDDIETAKNDLMHRAEIIFPKMKDATFKEVYMSYKTEISSYSKRNYQYRMENIDRNVYLTVPGKFSLCFSLAVNIFKEIMGHYPNTYVIYKRDIDVSRYIENIKHKNMILQEICALDKAVPSQKISLV